MLETIEFNPPGEAQLSVIWMHGLGADGHDFEGIVPYLGLPPHCHIRFVFPHAPYRSVTINMGMRMRAWYDILNPALGYAIEDSQGIDESCSQIVELIKQENDRGFGSQKIVLAGFSQGGAIALHLGVRYPEKLAGILALSTYLPRIDATQEEMSVANRDIPILYLHGTVDPVVPIVTAERSRQVLIELGFKVQMKDYPIPHSVSPEEMVDIGRWLAERFETASKPAKTG